nr:nucleolin-like isoform X2 [Rhipicephalus microplus]
MAFKKSPAQAQKSSPKSAGPAGKKAPPTKKPLAASLDDDDDDLDEEDDDFSMDEDSDLSGADEELDDEELDDEDLDEEDLDDEELDDEELDEESEDEDVPAPKAAKQEAATAKIQGQQQKSPVKQSPQMPKEKVPIVNGKRKAESDAGSSPAKKIRLEDHIPASFVTDYEARDLCDVKLSSFTDGVTSDDVKKLCKDGSVMREIVQNKKIVCAFVRYANKEKAMAAVRSLQGANLKGASIKASYCGERWSNPASRPQFQPDTLDIRRVPKEYLKKEKLAAIFPTGEVLKVQPDGYAQVKFPSSEALIKALKNPKCRTIDNQNLEFAVALVPKRKHNKPAFNTSQNAAPSPKNKKAKKGGNLQTQEGTNTAKRETPNKQPGGPSPKGSPHTPAQQKKQRKKSKSPGQQGGPKMPGQQRGAKTPGQKGGPRTPGQKGGSNTPGVPRTPGQQAGLKTPKGPKTPGQQGGPKAQGQQVGPHTPGQKGPHTPGQKGPHTPGQKGPHTPGQKGPQTPGQKGPQTPGQKGPYTPGQKGPQTPGQKGPKTPGQKGPKTPKGTPFQKSPGLKVTPAMA